jgi:hypothetical protein
MQIHSSHLLKGLASPSGLKAHLMPRLAWWIVIFCNLLHKNL